MRYCCQCNCNSPGFIEQMLIRLVVHSGIMPLVPEQLRTYPSAGRSRAFLAAEAISAYLDINEWQISGIARARLA